MAAKNQDQVRKELNSEKDALKDLKMFIKFELPLRGTVRSEHLAELIEYTNMIIGRINCELTDNDKELDAMAIADGIRRGTETPRSFMLLKSNSEPNPYEPNSRSWHQFIDVNYARQGEVTTFEKIAKINGVELKYYDDVSELIEDGIIKIVEE